MVYKTNRKPFINLIVNFVLCEIGAAQFVARFMRLWRKGRDAQWEVKSSWSNPLERAQQELVCQISALRACW